MPKTTVYYWIKDISIPRTNKQNLQAYKASRANVAKWKKLRDQAYREGIEQASTLLNEQVMRDFIVMYMGEGYKKNRNVVSIANSDPEIMAMSFGCMKKLTTNKMTFTIQVHKDQDEEEVKQFWANTLNISPQEIKTTRKSNSGNLSGRKWRSKYGVLSVRVGDTYLRCRIQALIDTIKKEWKQCQT
jgi:hypothetical protein